MSICHYNVTTPQSDSCEINEQFHGTPVPLEQLPAGLIEDEI